MSAQSSKHCKTVVRVENPDTSVTPWRLACEESGTDIVLSVGDTDVRIVLDDEPGRPGSGLVRFLVAVLDAHPDATSFDYERRVRVDVSQEVAHHAVISGELYDGGGSDDDDENITWLGAEMYTPPEPDTIPLPDEVFDSVYDF